MRYRRERSTIGTANTRLGMLPFLVLDFFSVAVLLPSLLGCNEDITAEGRDSSSQDLKHSVEPVQSAAAPPDLSDCTRLEIRYPLSTLDYFLPGSTLQQSLLSPDEKEYIQSIEFFTLDDPERIKAFARDVSLGTYRGNLERVETLELRPVGIRCYCSDEHITSFTVSSNAIVTEDKRIFTYPERYPQTTPNVAIIEPMEMQPFKLRYECASNMRRIYTSGPLSFSYPNPIKWCDIVIQDRTNARISDEQMRGWFKCPGAPKGKCHYALNPHCKLRSPPDTVLLFETNAGWDAHGGPELFTFDHHEPRGGRVMLNDRTVKFIRTKEELQQLRWK